MINNGTLFVGGNNCTLNAVNLADHNILWSSTLESSITSGFFIFSTTSSVGIYATPTTDGNKIYVGSYIRAGSNESGRLFAFTADSRDPVWIYPSQGTLGGAIIGGPAVAQGIVYVGATDGKLYAVDAANAFPTPSHPRSLW